MAGRLTPSGSLEGGLPDKVYTNPDNLPIVHPNQLDSDEMDAAPQRGQSGKGISKLKEVFRKDKDKAKKKEQTTSVAALSDALDKPDDWRESSKDDSRVQLPVSKHQQRNSRMSSFREFFARKPNLDQGLRDPKREQTWQVSTRSSFRNFFRGPPVLALQSDSDPEQLAELRDPGPTSPRRMGIFLIVLFVLIVLIGIVLLIAGLTGDSRRAQHCMVLGPTFLLLGCFVIIGHVFFVLLWSDDPLPCLNDCMAKVNSKIGGIPDPYGLKCPETYVAQRSSYHPGLKPSEWVPPASPTAKETIAMKSLSQETRYQAALSPSAYESQPYGKVIRENVGFRSYQNSSYQDDSYNADNVI